MVVLFCLRAPFTGLRYMKPVPDIYSSVRMLFRAFVASTISSILVLAFPTVDSIVQGVSRYSYIVQVLFLISMADFILVIYAKPLGYLGLSHSSAMLEVSGTSTSQVLQQCLTMYESDGVLFWLLVQAVSASTTSKPLGQSTRLT